MRVEKLEKCVCESVIQMKDPEALQTLLSYCGNGNIYQMSIENIFAVYYQRPDATLVTGFDCWKKTGRYPLQHTGIAVFPFESVVNWMDDATKIGAHYITAAQIPQLVRGTVFANQKIDGLVTMPMLHQGKVVGFIGIVNPKKHQDNIDLLASSA